MYGRNAFLIPKGYKEARIFRYERLHKVLLDTIDSCICIMGRNGIRPDEYAKFQAGINAIQGHILKDRINGENAGLIACEIMYLAACILVDKSEYVKIKNPEEYRSNDLTMKGSKRIKYIRNVDPLAYAYLTESFRLLQNAGYYKETIL